MKSAVIDVRWAAARVSGESISVGPDAVDADAAVAPFERQRARDAQDAALGGEVGARPGVGDERADRREVDDAALALGEHLATERLAAEVGALEVEVEDEVELVLREILGRGAKGRAGAVDQDVDPAVRSTTRSASASTSALRSRRGAGRGPCRPAPRCGPRSRPLPSSLTSATTTVTPAWAIADCDRPAQAAAATGDDRDAAREVEEDRRRSPAGTRSSSSPNGRCSVICHVTPDWVVQLAGSLG